MSTKPAQVTFVAQELSAPSRLDRVIRAHFPNWGRRAVQTIISRRQVRVNGRQVWLASWKVHNGDRLTIHQPPADKTPPPTHFDDKWLIAEERDVIVINKPSGLLSHKPRWRESSNLLTLAQARFGPLTLFHRLDRDTSGVILLTRNQQINRELSAAFKKRTIQKVYLALTSIKPDLPTTDRIAIPLDSHPKRRDMMTTVKRGGKWAVTRYEILAQHNNQQLVRLYPETGRTHQLRIHLQHLGIPILGDRLYGNGVRSAPRLMLHAYHIALPALESQPARQYTAPVPKAFLRALPNDRESSFMTRQS